MRKQTVLVVVIVIGVASVLLCLALIVPEEARDTNTLLRETEEAWWPLEPLATLLSYLREFLTTRPPPDLQGQCKVSNGGLAKWWQTGLMLPQHIKNLECLKGLKRSQEHTGFWSKSNVLSLAVIRVVAWILRHLYQLPVLCAIMLWVSRPTQLQVRISSRHSDDPSCTISSKERAERNGGDSTDVNGITEITQDTQKTLATSPLRKEEKANTEDHSPSTEGHSWPDIEVSLTNSAVFCVHAHEEEFPPNFLEDHYEGLALEVYSVVQMWKKELLGGTLTEKQLIDIVNESVKKYIDKALLETEETEEATEAAAAAAARIVNDK